MVKVKEKTETVVKTSTGVLMQASSSESFNLRVEKIMQTKYFQQLVVKELFDQLSPTDDTRESNV
ncbi:MAG: hypothetical protein FWB72_02015 [Firmicutes bacterium]|nr:hypothetical protein [Bacillota bacterium]